MNQWLISPEELHNLNASDATIFDCRFSLTDHNMGRNLYLEGHIPNACFLDMEVDLSGDKALHGGRHPLPEPEAFALKMRQCGINQNSLIIAYDNNRMAGAARLWWLLKLFGHTRVKILDGGLAAWKNTGLAITTQPSITTMGNFEATISSSLIVDRYWIRQHLIDEHITLIDSREAPRYLGLTEPIDPFAGHIPGAINSPWQHVTNSEGQIKSPELQRQIWQALPMTKNPVVYCGSGVSACVNLLSLSVAGIDNGRLYAGSWSDWCSYPEYPLEPPATQQPIAQKTEPLKKSSKNNP
ncbi:MAG: sulfurtransferase [Porticoccus sp.]|nr:sulfurtransferase [Porticoccus sp.]